MSLFQNNIAHNLNGFADRHCHLWPNKRAELRAQVLVWAQHGRQIVLAFSMMGQQIFYEVPRDRAIFDSGGHAYWYNFDSISDKRE